MSLCVGDLVLHAGRDKYFYNPQSLGILIERGKKYKGVQSWRVFGYDWRSGACNDSLVVLETELERIN